MKYSPYPERLTAFSRQAQRLDVIHALIAKGKPWRNGLLKRSNRTDNDALFHQQRFRCEEHRCYQLRLWEMYYNRERPHQSLNRQTPQALAHQQHFYRTYNLTLS